MVRIFAGLLALNALLSGAAPAIADTVQHPGRFLGSGEADKSGDSRYLSFDWCGERLWVVTDNGPLLIDPENGGAISLHAPAAVVEHPGYAGLIACSQSAGQTILWFDSGEDTIIWQDQDGAESGELRGFVRGAHTWDLPLIDITESMVVGISAKGRKLEATKLPPGLALVSIPEDSLAGVLKQDRLADLSLLSGNLLEIGAFHVSDDGTDSRDPRHFDTFIANVDFSHDVPVIGEAVTLEETLPDGIDDFLTAPTLEAGQVAFKVRSKDQRKDCRLVAVAKGPVEANCTALPPDYKTLYERMDDRLDAYDRGASPSGRWFAWDEWVQGEAAGKVRFYVAPTADLLKP